MNRPLSACRYWEISLPNQAYTCCRSTVDFFHFHSDICWTYCVRSRKLLLYLFATNDLDSRELIHISQQYHWWPEPRATARTQLWMQRFQLVDVDESLWSRWNEMASEDAVTGQCISTLTGRLYPHSIPAVLIPAVRLASLSSVSSSWLAGTVKPRPHRIFLQY